MVGHGPAAKLGKDNASQLKSRFGVILFFVYLFIYSGFVAINTVSPETMEAPIMFGVNLAVIYGLGLIVVAIVLGLIYNHI